MNSKKSLSVAAVAIATKVLVPKLSIRLWRCNTWTRPGLFWSACLPRPTAVYFRDREGPWATLSSRCYCLPRWARTPCLSPSSPTTSPSPSPPQLSFSSLSLSRSLSLSGSRSLPLSPSLLSVFVPQGPVVQLKLSVTQRNQIGFHLQPVTSCVHCAFVLPLSAEKV